MQTSVKKGLTVKDLGDRPPFNRQIKKPPVAE